MVRSAAAGPAWPCIRTFISAEGVWMRKLLCALAHIVLVRGVHRLKRTGADVLSHGEEVVMISEKFEAGTTVKDELTVTHPGSYILRWDNTHSRLRGKQIQYEHVALPWHCSIFA